MKSKTIILTALAGFLLSGCAAYEKKNQSGAAVDVNGHYLYRSTLDSLTLGMSSEDSLRFVQQYVSQWAKDILMYDKAKHRMPKAVPDSTVQQVYDQMPDRFLLDESIVKGILVVVPNDAPHIAKLRGWMAKVELDNIEKYAYQNASGYELFVDRWLTATDLITNIPLLRADLENMLRNKDQIEVSDSTKTYLLQITEKHLRGAKMPLDYARPEIEKIILNERQVEFLQKERERLYNEAIQEKKIQFYE